MCKNTYPFNEPIMMPLTKYFWIKEYINISRAASSSLKLVVLSIKERKQSVFCGQADYFRIMVD